MTIAQSIRKECSVVFVDADRTAVSGNIPKEIAKRMLEELRRRGDVNTYDSGVAAMSATQAYLTQNPDSQPMGLKMLYDFMMTNQLGAETVMSRHAEEYVNGNKVSQVVDLLKQVEGRVDIVIATAGGSTGARILCESLRRDGLKIDGYLSNRDHFVKKKVANKHDVVSMLSGVDMVIRNGDGKLNAVEHFSSARGVKLGDCAMIGDDIYVDGPTFRSTRFKIASPFADSEVRAMKGMVLLRA